MGNSFDGQNAIDVMMRQVLEQARQIEIAPRLRATEQVASRVQNRDFQVLNDRELKSIYALLAYVAHCQDVHQETVQAVVEAKFGVNHVARLPQKSYEEVVRFLVDLDMGDLKN